ncbi:hypothetical protein [Kitasatospora sp. NPDC087314]|uniref:hypothetical protein n=1 Tax=Kitasatospora sp. NPDC087314 TaxID=3364068 RepID=UPI00381FA50E
MESRPAKAVSKAFSAAYERLLQSFGAVGIGMRHAYWEQREPEGIDREERNGAGVSVGLVADADVEVAAERLGTVIGEFSAFPFGEPKDMAMLRQIRTKLDAAQRDALVVGAVVVVLVAGGFRDAGEPGARGPDGMVEAGQLDAGRDRFPSCGGEFIEWRPHWRKATQVAPCDFAALGDGPGSGWGADRLDEVADLLPGQVPRDVGFADHADQPVLLDDR